MNNDDMTLGEIAKQSPEAHEAFRHLFAQISNVCGVAFFRRDGTPVTCMEPSVIVKMTDGLPHGYCAKHQSLADGDEDDAELFDRCQYCSEEPADIGVDGVQLCWSCVGEYVRSAWQVMQTAFGHMEGETIVRDPVDEMTLEFHRLPLAEEED